MKRILPIFLILSLFPSCEWELGTIHVTGVSVHPAELALTEGETATLTVTVLPEEATDKTVLWASSDATVASVSDGTVSAHRAGSARIFVTTSDGGFQADCKVTVESALRIDPGQNLKPVFDEKGGTATVSFQAAGPWTASFPGDSGKDWIKLEPAQGGAGAATLKLTVAENTGFEDRDASVRIQCGETFETVVVSQKQKDDLTVTASSFEIGPEGGNVSVEVKANIDYTYRIEGDWIKAVGTRAYQARTLTFEVARNETISKREGSVTFTGGGFSETVRIFQEGETPTIVLSQNEYGFESTGGTFHVTVRSNVDVAVEMPAEAPWIKDITTRTVTSHQFSFEVAPNPDYDDRSAGIRFVNKDNGLAETVTVRQKQKDALILTDNEVLIPETGGEFEVKLSSNVGISVKIDGDWIREVPGTRGLTESAFRFTADPLPVDRFLRQGTLVFSGAGLSGTVAVRQKEDSPVIQFKDQEVKRICVREWDRNGDGELSEREAAAVTDLGWARFENTGIHSFDELQFFTSIETLPVRCFQSCSSLTSVTLPPGLRIIGDNAFERCTALTRFPELPESLKEIRSYAFAYCYDVPGELNLPAGLELIASSAFSNCRGLTGSLQLPDKLKTIGSFAFTYCTGMTGPLVLPEGLTELDAGAFDHCSGFTGDLTIPEGVTEIRFQCFLSCSGLNGVLTLPETVRSIGSLAFGYPEFARIDVKAQEPPACDNSAFAKIKCPIFVPSGKARIYHEAPGWKTYLGRITEEGHDPTDFFYASTDYSRDGEVLCLQKATKGKGIDLVFLGDGFVDKDMEPGGKYETFMKRWLEQFFVYEPYKSFRDWFSVYTVKVVSKHDVYGCPSAERRLTRDDGNGDFDNTISTLYEPVDEYVSRVPGKANRVTVFMNTDQNVGRSFCSFGGSYFRAWVFDNIDKRPSTLNHEAGGHGFGWLGDEYVEYSNAPSDPQRRLENNHRNEMYLNVDWRSNPETVRWSPFLQDSRYGNEGLGVFEGALLYPTGFYRPTMNSMMRRDYDPGAVFNAPSREAIYRNIMRYGVGEDWEYDYETFVAADEAGRKQAAEAYATYPPTRASVLRDDFEPGLPPIFLDGPVKEIRISKDGTVTLIR